MDGDSGDEGNDKLTCVKSDESDKSVFEEDDFDLGYITLHYIEII